MNDWIWAGGLVTLVFGLFAAYWIYKRGEYVAEGREAKRKVIELEKYDKKKNAYLKDIDRINNEKEKLHEEARRLFADGLRAGDVLSLLDKASHRSKTKGTGGT